MIVVLLRIVNNVILVMIGKVVKILKLNHVAKRLKIVMKVGIKLKMNIINVSKMLNVI